MERVFIRLEDVKIPILAAISGACTGGGAGIAAGCDLRIAGPSARFGFPVARTLGNCLSIANYARFVSLIGVTAVKQMIYTAELFDARRMYELGFLNEVTKSDERRRGAGTRDRRKNRRQRAADDLRDEGGAYAGSPADRRAAATISSSSATRAGTSAKA